MTCRPEDLRAAFPTASATALPSVTWTPKGPPSPLRGFGEAGYLVFPTMSPMVSPQTAAAMKDAERFLDMEKTYALVVKDTTVIGQ